MYIYIYFTFRLKIANCTIGFLDVKKKDTKIAILSNFVQKLRSKTYFSKMVDNVMHLHTSHVQTTQDIF